MSSLTATLLISLRLAAASVVDGNWKRLVEEARGDAEERLRATVPEAGSSPLLAPLFQLRGLEAVAGEDLEDIAAFGGGQVSAQLASSLRFWKSKMEETIRPYITTPQAKNRSTGEIIYLPPKPIWIDSEIFRIIGKKITKLQDEGLAELKQHYEKQLENIKAKDIEGVTLSSWNRLLLDKLLYKSEREIRNACQRGKIQAGYGKNENVIENLRTSISKIVKKHNLGKI